MASTKPDKKEENRMEKNEEKIHAYGGRREDVIYAFGKMA